MRIGLARVDTSLISAIVILLLVMDPIGNIPLFASLMRHVRRARRTRVILRECCIAYAVLLVFAFFGRPILSLLGLSGSSLSIAGGVILFLIALRMIFRHPDGIFGDPVEGEPFIVPLAIPAIAGPAAIAAVMLMVSRAPERLMSWCLALTVAMLVTVALLLSAERVSRLAGKQGLLAFERLMGLILTAIAVEMLLGGIQTFVRQL